MIITTLFNEEVISSNLRTPPLVEMQKKKKTKNRKGRVNEEFTPLPSIKSFNFRHILNYGLSPQYSSLCNKFS